MALNKANITWSCKQIAKMAENGRFSFDNIIQRSYVWEQSRKSQLIHSLIEGYPVPALFAKRVDGRIYDFLDGKQRINAIRGFLANEYYLIGIPEVTYINADGEEVTENIEGMYFNDLPDDLKDAINDYHLSIFYYEDITPEQIRTLFRKLNNGKPLSTKERNIASCIDIENVTNIGEHELFKVIMTEKGLEKRNHIPMIMKVWAMLNLDIDDVSFESKDFNEIMQETKMADDERATLVNVFDKFLDIYNEIGEDDDKKLAKFVQRKMKSETHFVSLAPFIKQAIDDGIEDSIMADFIKQIFGGDVLVSAEYAEACKGGSAKNVNIQRRNTELDNAWENFFNDEEKKDDNIIQMPVSDNTDDETDNKDDTEKSNIEKPNNESWLNIEDDEVEE